jgi:hypothetical protein
MSLYDVVISLYDVVMSLYDVVISLYDVVQSLYDVVLSLYNVVTLCGCYPFLYFSLSFSFHPISVRGILETELLFSAES